MVCSFWLLAFGTSFHSTSTKEPAHRALMGVAALACDQWRPCDPIETMRGASQKRKGNCLSATPIHCSTTRVFFANSTPLLWVTTFTLLCMPTAGNYGRPGGALPRGRTRSQKRGGRGECSRKNAIVYVPGATEAGRGLLGALCSILLQNRARY